MIDLGPRTNKGVAIFKLVHQREPRHLLDDHFIELFLSPEQVHRISELPPMPTTRPAEGESCFMWSAYWYTILRERFIDDFLRDALANGCRQVVSFGAGYETRYFRMIAEYTPPVHAFEFDLPETIEDKRDCLDRSKYGIPETLHLAPFDLRTDSYALLQTIGYSADLPTAFIVQGVSYYLQESVFIRLLDFVSSEPQPRSWLIYDGCHPEMSVPNDTVPGIRAQIERHHAIGEPYVFAERPSVATDRLNQLGWTDTHYSETTDLEHRYLDRRIMPDRMWYVVHGRRGV